MQIIQSIQFDPLERFIVIFCGPIFSVYDLKKSSFIESSDIQMTKSAAILKICQFSQSGKYFVVGGDDKLLRLFDCSNWKCITTIKAKKKVSSVQFSQVYTDYREVKKQKMEAKNNNSNINPLEKQNLEGEDKALIFSDKFGDVYNSLLPELKETTILLGHCALITNICLSPNKKLLVTSDREEKIRLSQFPDSYNIYGYLLGHKSIVADTLFSSNENILFSCGGDGSIKVWKVKELSCIQTIQVAPNRENSTKLMVSKLAFASKLNKLAALIENLAQIFLFDYGPNSFVLKQAENIDFTQIKDAEQFIPLDIKVNPENQSLLVGGANETNKPALFCFDLSSTTPKLKIDDLFLNLTKNIPQFVIGQIPQKIDVDKKNKKKNKKKKKEDKDEKEEEEEEEEEESTVKKIENMTREEILQGFMLTPFLKKESLKSSKKLKK